MTLCEKCWKHVNRCECADKKMTRRPKKDPIQRHHLEYQEGTFEEKTGEVVKIYRSEHFLITKMQWRQKVSKGFIEALRHWINEVEKDAVDLSHV